MRSVELSDAREGEHLVSILSQDGVGILAIAGYIIVEFTGTYGHILDAASTSQILPFCLCRITLPLAFGLTLTIISRYLEKRRLIGFGTAPRTVVILCQLALPLSITLECTGCISLSPAVVLVGWGFWGISGAMLSCFWIAGRKSGAPLPAPCMTFFWLLVLPRRLF